MDDEEWLPVIGWEGYEVSSKARVRSVDRYVPLGGNRKPRLQRGQMLTPHSTRKTVALARGGKVAKVSLEQLVREAFGSAPPGLQWAMGLELPAAQREPRAALICYRGQGDRADISHWSSEAQALQAHHELSPCSNDCIGLHAVVVAVNGRCHTRTLNPEGTP